MKIAIAGIVLAATLASGGAAAGQLDGLKGMMGGGSMTSGTAGNAAGILQYCMTNHYLGGDSGAAGVKDKLLGSLGGDPRAAAAEDGKRSSTSAMLGKLAGGGNTRADTTPTQDKGYLDGARGILTSSDGKSLNLGGAGAGAAGTGDMKAQLTRKVCDAVLKQGRKMAGM